MRRQSQLADRRWAVAVLAAATCAPAVASASAPAADLTMEVAGAGAARTHLGQPVAAPTAPARPGAAGVATFALSGEPGAYLVAQLRAERVTAGGRRPSLYAFRDETGETLNFASQPELPAGPYVLHLSGRSGLARARLTLPGIAADPRLEPVQPVQPEHFASASPLASSTPWTVRIGGAVSLPSTGILVASLRAWYAEGSRGRGEMCEYRDTETSAAAGAYEVGCPGGQTTARYPMLEHASECCIEQISFEAAGGTYGLGGNFSSTAEAPAVAVQLAAIPYAQPPAASEPAPLPPASTAPPVSIAAAGRLRRGRLQVRVTCTATVPCRGFGRAGKAAASRLSVSPRRGRDLRLPLARGSRRRLRAGRDVRVQLVLSQPAATVVQRRVRLVRARR